MPKTIVLSLGGSLIVPNGIDIDFLKKFRQTIEKCIKQNCRFAIYCGGGMLARSMQKAASEIAQLNNRELDIIGIGATKLNALLLKSIFKNDAEGFIVHNPNSRLRFSKKVLIASGWLPGCSTDYDAVLLAKNLGITEVVNMSNISYVYDKDPRKHKDAKKIEKIKWKDYLKLIGDKWEAGMNVPFDPIAAKEAQKSGIKVVIIGGDLKNFENLLGERKFRGTLIQ